MKSLILLSTIFLLATAGKLNQEQIFEDNDALATGAYTVSPTPSIPSGYGGRQCTSITQGKAYLDVVIAFDASKDSGSLGLNGQLSNAIGYLSYLHLGQGLQQVSRVSYVTISDTAKVFSDLNAYSSSRDAINGLRGLASQTSIGTNYNLYSGLNSAYTVFNGTARNGNYQKVLIVYGTAQSTNCSANVFIKEDAQASDPCRLAQTMKNQGINIITVTLDYQNTLAAIGSTNNGIASKCHAVNNDDDVITNILNLLSWDNCFCTSKYKQFYDDTGCIKAGECLYYEDAVATYSSAQFGASLDNGVLVDVLTPAKNNFVMQQLKGKDVFIGLNQIDNAKQWQWDSTAPLAFTNFQGNAYSATGSCASFLTNGAWNATSCVDASNAKPYIYQISACDSNNFCP